MSTNSQRIASSSVHLAIRDEPITVTIKVEDRNNLDELLLLLDSKNNLSLSLSFEDIRSVGILPVIDIYINLLTENVPSLENYVGGLALYGSNKTFTLSGEDAQPRQDIVFNASKILNTVRGQVNWSQKQVVLTLIPSRAINNGMSLTIGSIALYLREQQ
jgi:hypothetical protein